MSNLVVEYIEAVNKIYATNPPEIAEQRAWELGV